MGKKTKPIFILVVFLAIITAAGLFIKSHDVPVLNPAGTIASRERSLILEATGLMLIVVVPVYVLTFWIAWRFREDNTKARYEPDWDHNRRLELAWWAIPIVIISILAVITYRSSHQLDPFKPLASDKKPLDIEVVALQWKWLFIYPQQNIASVNLAEMPVNTPVNFQITSDAPMNSFWIPALAGQIYAMSGMSSQLHIQADKTGDFRGVSANISGQGFADMHFVARSASQANFGAWVNAVKKARTTLDFQEYGVLAKPTTDSPVMYYSYAPGNLYSRVLQKYNRPAQADPIFDYSVAKAEVQ